VDHGLPCVSCIKNQIKDTWLLHSFLSPNLSYRLIALPDHILMQYIVGDCRTSQRFPRSIRFDFDTMIARWTLQMLIVVLVGCAILSRLFRGLRLQYASQNSGRWLYFKRLYILKPHMWPSKDRKTQLWMVVLALHFFKDRALQVLIPRQLGSIMDGFSLGWNYGQFTSSPYLAPV
jgi:hypothetical protein